jgi:hypothetical protein
MDVTSGPTAQRLAATMMRIAKYVYWIVGLVLVVGGCYFLYNNLERPVAAVLVFLGGILALYFYYVKWFVAAARNPAWPPYQTPCPDYLTLVSPGFSGSGNNIKPKAGEPYKCMDFVGVSKNGFLKKADPSLIETQSGNNAYTFTVSPDESLESLRAKTDSAGLSWISLLGN